MTRTACCTFSQRARRRHCATPRWLPLLTPLFFWALILSSITSFGSDAGLILPRARTKVRIPNLGLAVAQPAAAHWRSAVRVFVNSGISLEG